MNYFLVVLENKGLFDIQIITDIDQTAIYFLQKKIVSSFEKP